MTPPPEPVDLDSEDFVPPSAADLDAQLPGYDVIELVAQGGMGAIYKGVQTKLDRLVAIKVLPVDFGSELNFAARFEQEAKAMARLSHNHIVGVYDYGETADDTLLYFIMELVEGSTLFEKLQQGPLATDEVLSVLSQVGEALQYAHENGIIHRDIKPANILLDAAGNVRVADFGLARIQHSGADAEEETALGTPDYVAPETTLEGAVVDHRADIYALGVILYETLIGTVPRGTFDLPGVLREGLDRRFDQIIIRAMAPDPAERYPSVADFLTDLEEIRRTPRLVAGTARLATSGVALRAPATATPAIAAAAGPGRAARRPLPPAKKSSAGPTVALVLFLVLATGGAVYWFGFRAQPEQLDRDHEMARVEPVAIARAPKPEPAPAPAPKPEPKPAPKPKPSPNLPPAPDPSLPPPELNPGLPQRGRIQAFGTRRDGAQVNLSAALGIIDIAEVYARELNWTGLRADGRIVSSDNSENGMPRVAALDLRSNLRHFVRDDGSVWISSRDARVTGVVHDALQCVGGAGFSLARRRDATIALWGPRFLEEDPFTLVDPPVEFSQVVDVAATRESCAVLTADGLVHVWKKDLAVHVLRSPDPVVDVEGGNLDFIARTRSGKIVFWRATNVEKPLKVPVYIKDAVKVRAGGNGFAAQHPDGTWVAWSEHPSPVADKIPTLGSVPDLAFYINAAAKSGTGFGYVVWIDPLDHDRDESNPVIAKLIALEDTLRNEIEAQV
ncbi:MAG: protein kinase, partial [Verrucomicrobiales bacterium]